MYVSLLARSSREHLSAASWDLYLMLSSFRSELLWLLECDLYYRERSIPVLSWCIVAKSALSDAPGVVLYISSVAITFPYFPNRLPALGHC